jgi:hypothetical protein
MENEAGISSLFLLKRVLAGAFRHGPDDDTSVCTAIRAWLQKYLVVDAPLMTDFFHAH